MATFTIGGGNQGNISPFLTGKATPMSLPPGYLSAAAQQAARLQQGIAGAGEQIGDLLAERAKEEELKKEGIAYLMSTNKNLQQYPMFAARQTGTSGRLPILPRPQDEKAVETGEQVLGYEIVGKNTTKVAQPNPLEEILGGEAWEKITSGDVSKGELRGYIRGVDEWKEHKHGEVVRELNQMKLDALKKELAKGEAFDKTSQAVLQSRVEPGRFETETIEKTLTGPEIDELFREEVSKERTGEAYDPDKVLLREQLRSQEDFETRVPEGIKLRTLGEANERDAFIALINQSQGLPQLESQPQAFQEIVKESFDAIPAAIVERAMKGDLKAMGDVAKTMVDAQKTGQISTQAEMDAHANEMRKNLRLNPGLRGSPGAWPPMAQPGWVWDLAQDRYVRDPQTDPLPGDPHKIRTPEEEEVRQLKRGYKPKVDGSGFEAIKDSQGFPMGGREILADDLRQMEPEDQARFTDMVEPLYTGGERVIDTEEVERFVPGREKSPTELRGEIRDALIAEGKWSADTSKKLDELMPEHTPGVLEQARAKIGGVEMVVPGFMFDPVGKKYIEISTGKPIEFNEIQTKLASYRNLMKSAQRDVDEVLGEDNAYDPTSAVEYWQRVSPTYLASKKGLEYKDAAGRWIEARLRFATGAQAPATEYEKDWKNFFPVPGDSKRAVDRKKRARDEVYRTLSKILGAERTSYLDEGAPPAGGATGGGPKFYRDSQGKIKLNK